jgi:hypothetical protein
VDFTRPPTRNELHSTDADREEDKSNVLALDVLEYTLFRINVLQYANVIVLLF